MSHNFYTALETRRSVYAISKEISVSNEKIQEIIEHVIKHTPSAFNSQTGRVLLLLNEEHDKLWEMTRESLRKVVPEGNFQETSDRIDGFKAGYGTVLYFEDQAVIEGLQKAYALYKDNFPIWSLQSTGMLQSNIWTAFATEGIGASLQHYNELIEEQVKEVFELPSTWKMMAQMPFGKILAPAGEKEFSPLASRLVVVGA